MKNILPQKYFNKWLLPILVIITVFAFYSSVNNGFTNWDDDVNITKNAGLAAFHSDNLGPALKNIFAVRHGIGMYAPLVYFSYLVQYAECQLNPQPYHLLNLILHLLNTALVFGFIWLLCRQQWVAFITALLFSIHPMHVESVAWIAGRIDVLYSFFYLAALCVYLLYLKYEKWRWHFYVLALFLFVLALLTKASAVTLPVVFFVIDYFHGKKISSKTVLAKAPFVLLSFVFGYIAIYAQQGVVIQEDLTRNNFFDRGLFICYALAAYLWKLVAPINLACIYDYPLKHQSRLFAGLQVYPFIFYITPLIVMAIAWLVYKSIPFGKDVLFGTGFFLITIALVLPGFAVRYAIIADRYTYVSYIGLFFILARWLTGLWETKSTRFQSLKTPSRVALVLFLVWCVYLTAQCCEVWHDSITLWSNAIAINPNNALSYVNRANAYLDLGKNEEAIKEYNYAIHLKPGYAEAYFGRACGYSALGKYEEAIKNYNSAVKFKPNYAEAYNNKGNAFLSLGKFKDAVEAYSSAIRINRNYADAYNNLGNAYMSLGRYDEAVKDCDSAIIFKPYYTEAYYNRGNAYRALKQYENAIKDYSLTILINPAYASAYNNRGITYFAIQKFQLALDDAIKARQLGLNIDPTYIQAIEANINTTAK